MASVAVKEYDLVVVGNEPAGLWLLQRYLAVQKALANSTDPKAPKFALPKIAWLSLGEVRPLAIPQPVADYFGITGGPSWSAEFVTPNRVFSWNWETIQRLFPSLPADLKERFDKGQWALKGSDRSALFYTLRQNPELLFWASGLWRVVGRAEKLLPEALVWAALQCYAFKWWDPKAQLADASFDTIVISPEKERLKNLRTDSGGMTVAELSELGAIRSKQWLWNGSWRQIRVLTSGTNLMEKVFGVKRLPVSRWAEYRLSVNAKADATPQGRAPLFFLYDTEEMPDAKEEIWPVYCQRENGKVQLSVSLANPFQTSLDSVVDRSRLGYQRLNRAFPFLSENVESLFPPLCMESCAQPETRQAVLTEVEWHSQEVFRYAGFDSRTQWKGVFMLPPSYRCHLPYPMGTLVGANRLLGEWLGRKTRNWVEKQPKMELR